MIHPSPRPALIVLNSNTGSSYMVGKIIGRNFWLGKKTEHLAIDTSLLYVYTIENGE